MFVSDRIPLSKRRAMRWRERPKNTGADAVF
jgi:hypothetical protein